MRVPAPEATTITVTSPAFDEGQPIPRRYTCHDGRDRPPLAWRAVPDEAASLAVVVSDPDAPHGTFVHWVVYDLPPADGELTGALPAGAQQAQNSGRKPGWSPPCPPRGTHRYVFSVYALARRVTGRSTQDILDDIGRAQIGGGSLTGVVSTG